MDAAYCLVRMPPQHSWDPWTDRSCAFALAAERSASQNQLQAALTSGDAHPPNPCMSNVTPLTVASKVDPVARARAVGPSVAAVADEIESSQAIPEPVLTELHESRIYRMLLPRSVGGDQ